MFGQRDGKIEVFPFLLAKEPFEDGSEKEKGGARGTEKFLRFEFAQTDKSRAASREDERGEEEQERKKGAFEEEMHHFGCKDLPSLLR